MTLRIGVVARRLDAQGGLARALTDGLRQTGLDARSFADADAEAMHSDILLLLGQPSSCRQTVARIERAGALRPRVAAWLFEPLPPPDMPVAAIRRAARFSAIRTGRRWTRPLLQLLSRPLDASLARRSGYEIDALTLRFLVDSASFALRGRDLGWLDRLFVSTEQKRRQLIDWGIESEFLPVGQQADFGRDLGLERDIDVLFIGSLKSRRRQRLLATLTRDLSARGVRVHHPSAPIWGEARTELVNRARIVLHLHQYDWDTPWMRWFLATANGAVVASEPLFHPSPLRPQVDYLEAPLDGLAAAIAELARDEPRRLAMLAACRDSIAASMTQAGSVRRLAEGLVALGKEKA